MSPARHRLLRRRLLQAGAWSLGGSFVPALAPRAQDAPSRQDSPRAPGSPRAQSAQGTQGSSAAQSEQGTQASPRIATTKLGGGLVLLTVDDCNVLALHGDKGALMIDGGPAGAADALVRAVYAATGNDRIDTLIDTHWHAEQTGANEIVGRAGGTILAHEKTQQYLSHKVYAQQDKQHFVPVEPLPEVARPNKTVRGEGSLDFGGQHIDYGYLPAAHTDGDLFVHFPRLNVLDAGGVVSAERWPLLDWRNGAWFGGRVRALQRLATLVKPDTRVVPAQGPLLTGKDIAKQRDIYDALFKTMIGYMNMGLGREDVVARNPLKQYESQFGDASEFLEGAYHSMQIAYVPD